jgi:hypothetical protein
MYPLLSITKPDPDPPPLIVRVLIETTEGNTLCAIPATESGARSIVLVDDTKLTSRNSEPPAALTPKKPPRDPASSAINTRLPFALFEGVGACHHAPGAGLEFFTRGNIISVSSHLGGY